MAIHEVRESISIPSMTASDGLIFVERIINLQRGTRHTINAIDVFLDNPYFDCDVQACANIVISSQPMLLTSEIISNANGWLNDVPTAGVDTILYKGNFEVRSGSYNQITAEFPNNFLGASPTFSWYTPRLYMYVVITGGAGKSIQVDNFRLSAYVAVDSRKASYLSVMLGMRKRSSR